MTTTKKEELPVSLQPNSSFCQAVRIVKASSNLLKEHFGQGDMFDQDTGEYCSLGAVGHSFGMNPNTSSFDEETVVNRIWKNKHLREAFQFAYREQIRKPRDTDEVQDSPKEELGNAIYQFNDTRSKKAVLAKFKSVENFLKRRAAKGR